MRGKNDSKKYIPVLAGLLFAGLLTGCGKTDTTVYIKDGRTETEIAVANTATVADAIAAAGIALREKDTVSPERDATVTDSGEIRITRCAEVTFTDGETVCEMEMTGATVQDVLDAQNVTLGEHDYINHDPQAYLTDGMEIAVTHRLAVQVRVDGETTTYLSAADTVEELLKEQKIAVDEKDKIHPGADTALSEDLQVTIERVSVKEVTELEEIPFETEVEYSDSMYSDETEEKTPGVAGQKEVTYRITYVDGKEESRKALSENVIKEPVAQVVTQGTKQRRRIVSKQQVADCDGSGHGYYIITWSDGTVEYKDY